MHYVLENAVVVLITLAIAYLLAKLIIKAYFAAKLQYVNQMVQIAKELTSGKKG